MHSSTADLGSFERKFQSYRRKKTLSRYSWIALLLGLTLASAWYSGFFKVTQLTAADGTRFYGWVVAAGLPRLGEFFHQLLPVLRWESLGADIAEWFWGFRLWMGLLLETVQIAFVATVLGVSAGLLLSFPASRNLMPNRAIRWLCRRTAEISRTVPELVFALIFVFAFGIGPFAGVLAIALHTMGSMAKLYSEANENISMKPVEGIRASGGDWFDQIRHGVIPQVLPNVLSYTLLRFEINVRASSIIGYVGAGGLGQEFRTAMSYQAYTDVLALFIITLVTVSLIDWGSEKLRHRIIKSGERSV
jgi:phosphonate transport system permease protein